MPIALGPDEGESLTFLDTQVTVKAGVPAAVILAARVGDQLAPAVLRDQMRQVVHGDHRPPLKP